MKPKLKESIPAYTLVVENSRFPKMEITLNEPVYTAYGDFFIPVGTVFLVPYQRHPNQTVGGISPLPLNLEDSVNRRETFYTFNDSYICWATDCTFRKKCAGVLDAFKEYKYCPYTDYLCMCDADLDDGQYPAANTVEELAKLFVTRLAHIQLLNKWDKHPNKSYFFEEEDDYDEDYDDWDD